MDEPKIVIPSHIEDPKIGLVTQTKGSRVKKVADTPENPKNLY